MYSDLRLLDPVDAPQADQDILAAYVRKNSAGAHNLLEIRLDFMALSIRNQPDLYLALDHLPGGRRDLPLGLPASPASADIAWDTLLIFEVGEPIRVLDSQGGSPPNLAVQLRQDPLLDARLVSIDRRALLSGQVNWQLQAFTAAPGTPRIADRSQPFTLDAQPPPQAALLIAFWNSFPAYTPAQALRRWSGAHTGPLGGSHGLAHLLRFSREYELPVALLDLNSPSALSALDYAGGLGLARELAAKGLLLLPLNASGSFGSLAAAPYPLPVWLQEPLLVSSADAASRFGLPASQLFSGFPQLSPPAGYLGAFMPLADFAPGLGSVSPFRWRHLTVIPIPTQSIPEQATLDGLSAAARQALIETALASGSSASQKTPLFYVLGGDLTQSTWGEPRRARAAFEYIRAHPWIQPLDANSLITMPPADSSPPAAAQLKASLPEPLLLSLRQPAQGKLAQAAWHTFLALSAPVANPAEQLAELRMNYLGQVNALFAASAWELAAAPIASCQTDPDLDGEPECVLASESVYTITEIPEGSLAYAFVRSASGVHQLVGPSSQTAVGLGQPETWNLALGERADPAVIMGAFASPAGSFQPEIQTGQLILRDPTSQKIVSLLPDGLQLTYTSPQPQTMTVPLMLDPWERFTPGWGGRYAVEQIPGGFIWRLAGGFSVQVVADSPSGFEAFFESFIDTRSSMGAAENPNFNYPPGHYLPFPLALVHLAPGSELQVRITGQE